MTIRLSLFLVLCVFAACSPLSSHLPGRQVVTVEGRDHTVRRSGEAYAASMNGGLLQGKATEAEVYVGNLRAIRDATGCPVAMGSVRNEKGRTLASVACPTDRTARM